jgi:hypothetical protein
MLVVSKYMSERMQKCGIRVSKTGQLIPIISTQRELLSKMVEVSNGLDEISVPE